MNINEIKSALPGYAKDLRLNLDSILAEGGAPGLTPMQVRAVALAASIASRHVPLTRALESLAGETLSPSEIDGAKAAAAIMGMTNVYYRFTHLVSNTEYQSLRPGLRMNVMTNPGIEKAAFELAAMAVSAVNGCGQCMDAHEKVIRAHGVSATGLQSAIRIAAVVHAVAVTLQNERATASALAEAA